MKKQILFIISFFIIGLMFFGLSKYNYLLYHASIEIIISLTGFLIFGVSIISQSFNKNNLYVLLGPGFLMSSIVGILHMFVYSGMTILPGYDANLPTQLWIILSYLLSISFLVALLGYEKSVNTYGVLIIYFIITLILVASSLLRIFPDCFIVGQGLTPFKKISEYIIIFIYIISLILLRKTNQIAIGFRERLSNLLILLIFSSFFFTLYSDVYGVFNFLGHYFKLGAFLIIYTSLLKDLIVVPYQKILFDSIHDPLTGLYNHKFFFQSLKKNNYSNAAIINIDIDSLKLINDTLGYSAGDKLICETAKILDLNLPIDSMVVHISGGEFSIIIKNTDDNRLFTVTNELDDRIETYNTNNPDLPLSLTYGFAVCDSNDTDIFKVYRNACDNMYKKKILNIKSKRNTIVKTLIKTLEAKDFTTKEHACRMVEHATILAKALGLSEDRLNALLLFTEFHDIGKIGIPDRILQKPGPLNIEEKLVMQQHSKLGYEIAISSLDLAHISDFILKHHERWDGKGYPFGLAGEQIPIECRILSVIDSYDAMMNDRPYRRGMTNKEAVEELKRCSGTQFDPNLIKLFLEIIL